MQYTGHAFHPDFPKGKQSGTLFLDQDGLCFTANQPHLTSPLKIDYVHLQIERGGASNRLLFFKSTQQSHFSFYTPHFDILNDSSWPRLDLIQSQIRANQTQKRNQTLLFLLTIGLILVGLSALLLLKDPLIDRATQTIPTEWEVKLGDTLFENYLSGKKTIKDPLIKKELTQLLAPLLDQIQARTGDFKVELIEESIPNAFALPGGHIVIHSGLILLMDQPEDVLGVLAHEIGHVNRRHHLRHILNTVGLYALLSITIGDVSAIGGVIASQGTELMSLKNSRDHEREADEYGWQILKKAKINPQGLIHAFKQLQIHSEDQKDQILTVFDTPKEKNQNESKEKNQDQSKVLSLCGILSS